MSKVRSIAKDALDAAKAALGVASPSKVFRDEVGKMIALGWAEGISDNAAKAIQAIESVSEGMIDVASNEIQLPPIVMGEVVPYSFGKTNTNDTNNTLNKVLSMLEYNKNNNVTKDELNAILVEMFTRYMNINFSIGDEQLARHVNAGNQSLLRRFQPSIG